jgi:transglutaminase-like putative cysteine protease
MILEVQHETRLSYSEPVTESICEVRMEPVSNTDQSCHSFHVEVNPPAPLFRYQDGFGNHVRHFNLRAPHQEVRILAAAVVETQPRPRSLTSSRATYPLSLEGAEPGTFDFLGFRGPVSESSRLTALGKILQPQAGQLLGAVVDQICNYLHSHFQYARDVTLASSPIDDLLTQGKGVCQDFTHLMIALLRSFDIPARYVSGYIHRPNKESQSHAWCEVWFPDLGWLGVDPTNAIVVNDHFVKAAVGRDFTDVPPNKGVYRGRGHETISVRVETRALERLPSLAWQEQLPPLNVPLTAIIPCRREPAAFAEDVPQQ